MRARFIDADGRSFFDEVDSLPPVLRRFATDTTDYALDYAWAWTSFPSARIEIYRRETWFVPVGPIACPVSDVEPRLDVCYRIEKG